MVENKYSAKYVFFDYAVSFNKFNGFRVKGNIKKKNVIIINLNLLVFLHSLIKFV